jgi:hypothetical protein
MKTLYKTDGATTSFIIADLAPRYHPAARELYYQPMPEGFAKSYPADTPHLERLYRNFERRAEEMLLQTAGEHPVPWDDSLTAFLQRIEGQAVDWWLAGSAALAVRGLDVRPHDLDLVVDGPTARRLGDLLLDDLVEPVLPSSGWIADWFGRAFLHARLEWVGDVHGDVDTPQPCDFGPTVARRLEMVVWRGREIRVPPLDLQLQVSERRGLTARAAMIRRSLGSVQGVGASTRR